MSFQRELLQNGDAAKKLIVILGVSFLFPCSRVRISHGTKMHRLLVWEGLQVNFKH